MGGEGKQAPNQISSNVGARGLKNYAEAQSDPAIRKILNQFSQGRMNLNEAVMGAQGAFKADTGAIDQKIAAIKAARSAAEAGDHSGAGNILAGVGLGGLMGGSGMGGLGAIAGGLFGGSRNGTSDIFNQFESQIQELEGQKQAMQDRERYGTDAGIHQIFQDPTTGSLAATSQIRDNPLLKGHFGEGGLDERLLNEEKDLAARGYKLQPEDFEAYGQASDETARLFGQEESGLSNALASRGLAAGASGAAGVGYSGLQGNKLERLAASQRKIADDRMSMNRQRLNDVRAQALQSGAQAENAIQEQFGRNMTGIGNYKNNLQNALTVGQMEQGQSNAGFAQQQATQGPGIGGILGGLAGAGLGAAAGGIGTGVGSSLGSSIGSSLTKK